MQPTKKAGLLVAFGSSGCRGSAGGLAQFVSQVLMLSARVMGVLGECSPRNAISCVLWIGVG